MAVTFTRTTTTHDRTTDTITESTSSIVGTAMKTQGNPARYSALGLIESEAPTLLFTPRTYGDRIQPGDRCTFKGNTYTARDCDHLEPDGVVIHTKVIVER